MEWETTPVVNQGHHSFGVEGCDDDDGEDNVARLKVNKIMGNVAEWEVNGNGGRRDRSCPEAGDAKDDHVDNSGDNRKRLHLISPASDVLVKVMRNNETVPEDFELGCTNSAALEHVSLDEHGKYLRSAFYQSQAGDPSDLNPRSFLVMRSENDLTREDHSLSSQMFDSDVSVQTERSPRGSILQAFESTDKVLSANHLRGSITRTSGDERVQVANVSCVDSNFNVAFITDILDQPVYTTTVSNSGKCIDTLSYDNNQPNLSSDSGKIGAKTSTETAALKIAKILDYAEGQSVGKVILQNGKKQQELALTLFSREGKCPASESASITYTPSTTRSVFGSLGTNASLFSNSLSSMVIAELQTVTRTTVNEAQVFGETMEVDNDELTSAKEQRSNDVISDLTKCDFIITNLYHNDDINIVDDAKSLSKFTPETEHFAGSPSSDAPTNKPRLLITNSNKRSRSTISGDVSRNVKYVNTNTRLMAKSLPTSSVVNSCCPVVTTCASITETSFDNFTSNNIHQAGNSINQLATHFTKQFANSTDQPANSINQPASSINQHTSSINQPTSSINQPTSSINQPTSSINQPTSSINQPANSINQTFNFAHQNRNTNKQNNKPTNQTANSTQMTANSTQFASNSTHRFTNPAHNTTNNVEHIIYPANHITGLNSTHLNTNSTNQTFNSAHPAYNSTHLNTNSTNQTFNSAHPACNSTHLGSNPANHTSNSAHHASNSAYLTPNSANKTTTSSHLTTNAAHQTSNSSHVTTNPAHLTSSSTHLSSNPTNQTSNSAHLTTNPAHLTSSYTHLTPISTNQTTESTHLSSNSTQQPIKFSVPFSKPALSKSPLRFSNSPKLRLPSPDLNSPNRQTSNTHPKATNLPQSASKSGVHIPYQMNSPTQLNETLSIASNGQMATSRNCKTNLIFKTGGNKSDIHSSKFIKGDLRLQNVTECRKSPIEIQIGGAFQLDRGIQPEMTFSELGSSQCGVLEEDKRMDTTPSSLNLGYGYTATATLAKLSAVINPNAVMLSGKTDSSPRITAETVETPQKYTICFSPTLDIRNINEQLESSDISTVLSDISTEPLERGITHVSSTPSLVSSTAALSAAVTSPSSTAASSTAATTTDSRGGEMGRRLRIRNQRRFLPEKTRHKRQTLQDMTRPLKQWLYKHRSNPYPNKHEKIELVGTSRMSLTQVSNWFANARRRLKNTVSGDGLSWAKRITEYNHCAEGNVELFSIPSGEEWDSDDEANERQEPRIDEPHICQSRTPSPALTLTSSFSEPALSPHTTTPLSMTSQSGPTRCSPALDDQHNNYHKYKHSILQRYLQDASQQTLLPVDDLLACRARHRHLSSSTGSHDFEYLSTSSVSSPSHETPHDSFDEFSEEFETIAIRRRVAENPAVHQNDELYWKEIGAALALTSLAQSHVSK